METKKLKVNCIIGIDPGVSNGGICIYRKDEPKEKKLMCEKMPRDLLEFRDIIYKYKRKYNIIAFVEKVNLRHDDMETKDGKNRGKIFNVQKMLAQLEQIKTILSLLDVPFVLVHPTKWQYGLKLRTPKQKEVYSVRKNRYKEVAQDLYPDEKVVLWKADAMLIMHYGRYMLQTDLDWVLQNVPQRAKGFLF